MDAEIVFKGIPQWVVDWERKELASEPSQPVAKNPEISL